MSERPLVVAVDGPSGSGKSSVAKGVATRFGYRYLDTGAMYRAATWLVLERGADPSDPRAVRALLTDMDIISGTDPENPTIRVAGVDVGGPIRGTRVTDSVSAVSAVPDVRALLRRLQRAEVSQAIASGHGIVVEGRDIGTEVLPDADVKVFLTADPAVRAARRAAQDAQERRPSSGVEATEEALRERDRKDSTRTHSPLRMHDDATLVDATDMDLAQTIDAVALLVLSVREESR